MSRPTVAMLTDFGLEDTYVGLMKSVIADISPDCRIIDLCHEVPPQNILSGAYLTATAVPYLPDDAVLMNVVDPGVGSQRRAIACDMGDFTLVGPDNGIFDLVFRHRDPKRIHALENSDYFLSDVSMTFHGRDIFSPVSAHLASGVDLENFGPRISQDDLDRLPPSDPHIDEDRIEAHVIHIDRFGNMITNLTHKDLDGWADSVQVEIGTETVPLQSTFTDVANGLPVAYFGSTGQLEIAVNNGNAARRFGMNQNSTVIIQPD